MSELKPNPVNDHMLQTIQNYKIAVANLKTREEQLDYYLGIMLPHVQDVGVACMLVDELPETYPQRHSVVRRLSHLIKNGDALPTVAVEVDFHDLLRSHVRDKGIRASQLAALLGVTRASMHGVLTGRHFPREERLRVIATVLGLSEEQRQVLIASYCEFKMSRKVVRAFGRAHGGISGSCEGGQ